MIEAVIFDMDGVLVDSEYTFLESKTEILKESGFEKPVSYQYQFMGTTFEYMWSEMKSELNLPKPISFYIDEMNKKRSQMIEADGVKSIKGAPDLVKQLSNETHLKLAVASSSPKQEIINAMEALEIIDCFDALISGEEVQHSKPAPDVFLETAKQLGVAPEKCLVFEDTKNGSLAAKRAGMYVIGFHNPDYPKQDLSYANEIITRYLDFDINQIIK